MQPEQLQKKQHPLLYFFAMVATKTGHQQTRSDSFLSNTVVSATDSAGNARCSTCWSLAILKVLNIHSIHLFEPKPKIAFLLQYAKYTIYLSSTGGVQRSVIMRLLEQDRIEKFWQSIRINCDKPWLLDWEIADVMLKRAWKNIVCCTPVKAPGCPFQLIAAHPEVCTAKGSATCQHSMHTCPLCKSDFLCWDFEAIKLSSPIQSMLLAYC